ncbi:hypothetical protein [Microbacterium elymi]|uniref:Uncharacterized protein n=1 Tax=Microbacterium elymi TaxID=2909587 RepID=A0ABY5NLL2_9MICO|nr:hypothetical protein [Microbacterium elymi]UUT36078.1 hypothetical protein L2X98_23665 [Microbacterium elymi]
MGRGIRLHGGGLRRREHRAAAGEGLSLVLEDAAAGLTPFTGSFLFTGFVTRRSTDPPS